MSITTKYSGFNSSGEKEDCSAFANTSMVDIVISPALPNLSLAAAIMFSTVLSVYKLRLAYNILTNKTDIGLFNSMVAICLCYSGKQREYIQ